MSVGLRDYSTGRQTIFLRALEVKLDPGQLQLYVLPRVSGMGQEAEMSYRESKEMGTLPNRGVKTRKRKHEERLKMTDPWENAVDLFRILIAYLSYLLAVFVLVLFDLLSHFLLVVSCWIFHAVGSTGSNVLLQVILVNVS